MKPNDKAYREFMRVYNKTHVSLEAQVMASLTAAYDAQFPPIEDYAGLVKKLRSWRGCIASSDDCLAAADAIEALLAERDDFAEQLALRSESGMAKDLQEIMRINNELVAERDALAARLATVEDEALVEIAATAYLENNSDKITPVRIEVISPYIRAAIAAIRPHIEAAERERCVKAVETVGEKINVAHHERPEWEDGYLQGVHDAAAAIRRGE